MSNTNPDRLDDAQLDADLSVMGDDSGGEPKMPRLGDAPEPQSREGLGQATDNGRNGGATAVSTDGQRAAREAARDVVDGYGKA